MSNKGRWEIKGQRPHTPKIKCKCGCGRNLLVVCATRPVEGGPWFMREFSGEWRVKSYGHFRTLRCAEKFANGILRDTPAPRQDWQGEAYV